MYASFSQGYRGALSNGQAFKTLVEANFADPEKLNSFEVGMKSDLWNRRATLNVALFHYEYRDQRFRDAFALPGGTGTGFHAVNAPKSRIDGAEFELRAAATDDLEIDGGLGLMRRKYVEPMLHVGEFQAPGYHADLSIERRFLRLDAGDFRLRVDGNLDAKQYFGAFNTERIAQDAYGIANAPEG